jgi:hypothetical protein
MFSGCVDRICEDTTLGSQTERVTAFFIVAILSDSLKSLH